MQADRFTLAKRRWRGSADDGTDFGFDLGTPLSDGAAFFANAEATYRVKQRAEPVLVIALIAKPAPVARLGWTIGNLHFPIQVLDDIILVPDDIALRHVFTREKIPFSTDERVFTPFAKTHSHDNPL